MRGNDVHVSISLSEGVSVIICLCWTFCEMFRFRLGCAVEVLLLSPNTCFVRNVFARRVSGRSVRLSRPRHIHIPQPVHVSLSKKSALEMMRTGLSERWRRCLSPDTMTSAPPSSAHQMILSSDASMVTHGFPALTVSILK